MKVLLLGATGRTGKMVLQIAVEKGYELNCLVRNSKKICKKYKKINIFEGSPKTISDLEKALQGCEIIISVLNISRKSDFPWSKLRTPVTFLSDVMSNIIELSEKYNIKRILVCSAWGVSETKNDIPKWFKWLIDNSNISVAYKDHERQEELLKRTSLPWTIIRPTGLTNSKKEQNILESYENRPKPKMTISRLSVAKFMVNSIKEDKLIWQSPIISGNFNSIKLI